MRDESQRDGTSVLNPKRRAALCWDSFVIPTYAEVCFLRRLKI